MSRFLAYVAFLQLVLILGFMVAQLLLLSSQGCKRLSTQEARRECVSAHGCSGGARQKSKRYLSYQPPDGGWNNHRIAIENALVMARLLNRTLILHPLASHDRSLNLRRENIPRWKELEQRWGINWVYNIMEDRDLAPISEVLDLNHLSSLLDVQEVKTNHRKFLREFSNLSWHRVCHSNALGFWVEFLPSKDDRIRRRFLDNLRVDTSSSSRSRRACPAEMNRLGTKPRLPIVRGMLSELRDVDADLIYLVQDTSYQANIQFYKPEDAIEAQGWILNHIRLAPKVYAKVEQIVGALPSPFNAVHVRRTDHKLSASRPPSDWLNAMAEKHFLKISNALYVATDEPDKSWFQPFQEAGYQLYFLDEFLETSPFIYAADIRGLHDQLLCIRANLFVGSKGSSFSGFISRSRGDVLSYDDVIVQHMPVGWIGHKANRATQRDLAWERLQATEKAWKRALRRYTELQNMTAGP